MYLLTFLHLFLLLFFYSQNHKFQTKEKAIENKEFRFKAHSPQIERALYSIDSIKDETLLKEALIELDSLKEEVKRREREGGELLIDVYQDFDKQHFFFQ